MIITFDKHKNPQSTIAHQEPGPCLRYNFLFIQSMIDIVRQISNNFLYLSRTNIWRQINPVYKIHYIYGLFFAS